MLSTSEVYRIRHISEPLPPEERLGELPERYRSRTLDGYEPSASVSASKALNAALRMAQGEIRSLVLLGPPGVGKSHLAAGIARSFVEAMAARNRDRWERWHEAGEEGRPEPPERWWPKWQNVAELVVGLREDMDRQAEERTFASRSASLREWQGLVVLDDLGRERISDWTGEVIYTLVNARYEALLPTVATSNLSPEELATNGYWPAISRLAEDGALVRIDAPDRRIRR